MTDQLHWTPILREETGQSSATCSAAGLYSIEYDPTKEQFNV